MLPEGTNFREVVNVPNLTRLGLPDSMAYLRRPSDIQGI